MLKAWDFFQGLNRMHSISGSSSCWRWMKNTHLVARQSYYDLLYNLMHSQQKDNMLFSLVKFYATYIAWQIPPSVSCPALWFPNHDVCLPSHYSPVTSPISCFRVTFLRNISSTSVIFWEMQDDPLSLVDKTFLGDITYISLVKITSNFCGNKMPIQSKVE